MGIINAAAAASRRAFMMSRVRRTVLTVATCVRKRKRGRGRGGGGGDVGETLTRRETCVKTHTPGQVRETEMKRVEVEVEVEVEPHRPTH